MELETARRVSAAPDARTPSGGRDAIVAIIATFVVLISSMVGYNAWALSRESDTPLVITVTSRQRAYVESYIKDVLLKLDGHQADPDEDRRAMEIAADALAPRWAGSVAAGQPRRSRARCRRRRAHAIRIKLAHERAPHPPARRRRATRCCPSGATSPSFEPTLFLMRLTGAQLSSVTGDAAGEEARVAQRSRSPASCASRSRSGCSARWPRSAWACSSGARPRSSRRASARSCTTRSTSSPSSTTTRSRSTRARRRVRVLGYAPSRRRRDASSPICCTRTTRRASSRRSPTSTSNPARPSSSRSACVTGTGRG